MHQRISIGFSCAVLVVAAAQGCIQSSCEEKRTCGGPPPPSEPEAGSGGSLGLLPRTTGGRANFASAGAGGSESETATGGATSEAGSAGDAPEAALGGGGSGGEPASAAGGEPATSEPDACTPSPCAHGACSPLGASFECECDAGYSGDLCAKNIDDCTPNPCQNGGRCDDGVAEYACVCDGRFTGESCELPRFEIIEPEFEAEYVIPTSISGDGGTLAGYYLATGGDSDGAFVWRKGKFEVLSASEGFTMARVRVMSGDGTALFGEIGGRNQEGTWVVQAVVWRNGTVSVLPLPPGFTSSIVYGSSSDGSVVVGESLTSTKRAATIWREGSVSTLDLDPLRTTARGVSSDGRVVIGNVEPDNESSAFAWADGVINVLPRRPGAYQCWANGVSADGASVFGGCMTADRESDFVVRWTSGTLTDIEPPKEQSLQSPSISLYRFSPSGDAATGIAIDSTGNELPVIWTKELGMRWMVPILEAQGVDLSSYRWHALGRPGGISEDGKVIAGAVHDKDNVLRGFIARLP